MPLYVITIEQAGLRDLKKSKLRFIDIIKAADDEAAKKIAIKDCGAHSPSCVKSVKLATLEDVEAQWSEVTCFEGDGIEIGPASEEDQLLARIAEIDFNGKVGQ